MSRARYLWVLVLLAASYSITPAVSLDDYIQDGIYEPDAPQRRGQAGMNFLTLGGSARAEGMAGAFSFASGDLSSVFYNPAGTASITGVAAYANRASWNVDMAVNHFALAWDSPIVVVGLTFLAVDYGTIEGTVIADDPQLGYERTGPLDIGSWAIGLLVSKRLTDRFSVGAVVKYCVEDFGTSQVYSFLRADTPTGRGYVDEYRDNRVGVIAYDLGTQYKTGFRNLTLNMSLMHFAQTKTYVETAFDLPLTYRVGLSTELVEFFTGDELSAHKLLVSVDGVDRRDVDLDAAIGVEYSWDLSSTLPGLEVAIRGGRRAARSQDNWLSYGGGIGLDAGPMHVVVDYAFGDYSTDIQGHRLGLTISKI